MPVKGALSQAVSSAASQEHQAWILRRFLTQVEGQEAADEEEPRSIFEEFARLKSQSNKFRNEKTYSSKTAEKQDNVKKNRYKDIVPFDHSRVKLNFTTSKNDSDYINASFIKGASSSTEYIATQGPLPHTVGDFFRMLWEYNTEVVIMACREFEMGKRKCERYWPQKEEPVFVCEPFSVYCDSEENRGDYLTRTLQVTYKNCSRTLKQLHYVTWPDHGVPESIPSILQMLEEMRSYQTRADAPICIHCSAGCGRTGVLCVIDYTWNLLQKQMITPDFNIYDVVEDMRKQRPSLVQTKEQYQLVYRTVRLLFERHLQSAHIAETTVVSSSTGPGTENWTSEDIGFQEVLSEDRAFLPRHQDSTPSTTFHTLVPRDSEAQLNQQQQQQQQTLLQDAAPAGPGASLQSRNSSQAEELLVLHRPPTPSMAAAVCLMVEDPYFDSALSSPSWEEAPKDSSEDWRGSWDVGVPSVQVNDQDLELSAAPAGSGEKDEETPPPLPQRTPESYILAADADDSCETLTLRIPANAAAEAVRTLGGSPPSPVPPLPERTPESFQLATEEAPADQEDTWVPGGSGTPPERCSQPAASSNSDMKLFLRSTSLKTKSTFTALPDLESSQRTNFRLSCPPLDPLTHPLFPPPEDNRVQRPPHGTSESPEATTGDGEGSSPAARPSQPRAPRPASSCEWDGTSHAKKFFDIVKARSKSVRVRSSKPEPPAAAPAVPVGGSAQVSVSRRSSLTGITPGSHSEESAGKSMSRTKSLKIFKKKPTAAPPAPPAAQTRAPSPADSEAFSSFSIFKFGFGNRFRKPKGPRSYPDSWF